MTDISPTARIVCQFSCGTTSAVATKLVLAQYGATHKIEIINAYIEEELEDNRRFAADCERWFGRPITVLRDEKYGASVHAVWRAKRYMKGPRGAPCSQQLKRGVLNAFARPGDVLAFGFTIEEGDRLFDLRERYPEYTIIAPAFDRALGKADCKAIVERAGIQLPEMSRRGYDHDNCPGCCKGGEGYYRAIREDFFRKRSGRAPICTSIARPASGSRYASSATGLCCAPVTSRRVRSSARQQNARLQHDRLRPPPA